MELIEVGQTKVIVPRDSHVEKKGGLVLLEDINSYTARKVTELEAGQKELRQRLERLEKRVDELSQAAGSKPEAALTSGKAE